MKMIDILCTCILQGNRWWLQSNGSNDCCFFGLAAGYFCV